MSKNFDSTMNSALAAPNGIETGRSIEWDDTLNTYIWVWVDAANQVWYAHGRGAAWNPQQLTGGGMPLGHVVNSTYVKLAIDQVNDNVHIVYDDPANGFLWHARCTVPNNPIGANWTVYGANAYQRVCNCGNNKPNASICIDGNVNNGNNRPHVVFEITVGAGVVQYAYGNGLNDAFNPAGNVNLANAGESTPTIVSPKPEGRDLYVFWVNGQNIECVRCLDAANPGLAASWGGPIAGAGGGVDIAITGALGDVPSPPTSSWWWDADERIIVGTVLVGGTNLPVTNYWDETAGPAAWAGQLNSSNPSYGVPAGVMVVNRSNANNWTLYAFDNAGGLEYALEDGTYSFNGTTWYVQATTGPANNSYMSCEWRHLETLSASHSIVVWGDGADLWYGETRINTSTAPVLVSPISSAFINELIDNTFDWTFTDSEADTQREYYVEIDDDIAFGTPLADPGSGGAYLVLNAWTAVALDDVALEAAALAANTTYYWRVRTRDSEYGTEYDPDSESSYCAGGTFKTTPQIAIVITDATVKADKSVIIEFTISRDAQVTWEDICELTAFEVDSGGGWGAMTEDIVYHNPLTKVPGDMTVGTSNNFSFGWHAHLDLAANFDSTVDMRLTARYDVVDNDHGLGTVTDAENGFPIDFKAPTATDILPPASDTTTISRPTFTVSANDTNTWQFKIGIYRDAGHTILFDSSADTLPVPSAPTYEDVGTTTWKMNRDLDHATTWYARVKTRDSTPPQNEVAAWVAESFIFDPPPDPVKCQDGTFTLEIDPTKLWVGSEFDTLAMGDILGTVELEENFNSPNRLTFILNNYNGRYVDPTSDFVVQKGDEVKLVKGDKSFYGIVSNLVPHTREHRELKVYCESFSAAAEREPIQMRILSTEESGLYFEDYIRIGAQVSGLAPKWFKIVDADGNEIYPESASNKTPVLSGNPIIMNKVSFVELMNEYASRTGKVWWETGTPPTGRKAYIYLADTSDTSEGTADHTLHVETSVLEENMKYDFGTLINRVIFSDADVVEQDMNSIREHGVFLHKMRAGSSSTADEERLIEVAQHILKDRSSPRAFGTIPLEGEHDISPNDLVQIYEAGSDDTKSGFSGLYLVAGVDLSIGTKTKTTLSLSSRWEDPLIQDLLEMLKEVTSSGSDAVLTILRPETAESRLESTTDGVSFNTETTYVAFRLGIDRYSDETTDADYYSVYGID